MFLFVHTLRKRNERLSRLAVLNQSPTQGSLWLRTADSAQYGRHVQRASLLDPQGRELLHTLQTARVAKIRLGMHITGFEFVARGGSKSHVDRYSQSWLCAATLDELRQLVNQIPASLDANGDLIDEDDLAF